MGGAAARRGRGLWWSVPGYTGTIASQRETCGAITINLAAEALAARLGARRRGAQPRQDDEPSDLELASTKSIKWQDVRKAISRATFGINLNPSIPTSERSQRRYRSAQRKAAPAEHERLEAEVAAGRLRRWTQDDADELADRIGVERAIVPADGGVYITRPDAPRPRVIGHHPSRRSWDAGCRCDDCVLGGEAMGWPVAARPDGFHPSQSAWERGCRCEDCASSRSEPRPAR